MGKLPKEVYQFAAFFSSILVATYSMANMNKMRYNNEIVHSDPQPIDESLNEWIETEELVENPKIKKMNKHRKNLSLQEEYARLSGLSDWDHKPVPKSY